MHRGRWGRGAGATVATAALLLASCGDGSDEQAAPPTTTGASVTTAAADHGDMAMGDTDGSTTSTEPHEHTMEDMGPAPYAPEDLATHQQLAAEMERARVAARQVVTGGQAMAAGKKPNGALPAAPVDDVVVHYIDWPRLDTTFDIDAPEFVLTGGTGPDAPVVAIGYLVVGDAPPEGFAGSNDHWHRHQGTCVSEELYLLSSNDMPADECTALGGTPGKGDGWMLHVWTVAGWENPWGVFAVSFPELSAG